MIAGDVVDRLARRGKDVEPEQHRPQPVLLADVVGAGAGAFLATDRRHAGIEQIAEELPAGGRLEGGDAELLGDAVGGGAGRHRAGNALQPAGIAGGEMRVGGEHREAVRRGDEAAAPDDEVAVAVSVGGGAEIGGALAHHVVVEFAGVDEVGVGVVAAEIGQRRAVAHGTTRESQAIFEDFGGIGAGDRAHRVECHGEARTPDRVEIEQRFHQGGVIGDGIDHLDGQVADLHLAERIEVDIVALHDQIAVDRLRAGVDRLRHLFGRRAAIADIVLDAEILVRPAGIVAGGEDETAERLALADQVAGGGGGQDAALADDDAGEAVGGGHADRDLNHLAVEEAAVTADDQRRAILAVDRIEHRLDEIFRIMRLLEHPDLFAQAGCARLLVVIGRGRNGGGHQSPKSDR